MNDKNEKNSAFVDGTIVWSKIKGFPWWPAIVGFTFIYQIEKSVNKDKKISVKFIGDDSTGLVSSDNICPFNEGVNNGYSNSKKKKLLNAFEEALKLMSKSEADKYKKKSENKFETLELDENKDKSKHNDKSKI